jgi:hypothetical protein
MLYILKDLMDGDGSFDDKALESGAGSIDGPIAIILVFVGDGQSLVPLVDALHEGVDAVGWNAVGSIVEAVPLAVDVVGAGRRPEAVLGPGGSDGLEDSRRIGVVIFNVGEVFCATSGQRLTILAEQPQDIPQRPCVIGRLDGKERNLDELMVVLREHALPLLILIRSNAFFIGRVYLLVSNFHEVLELQLVLVPLGDVVCGV